MTISSGYGPPNYFLLSRSVMKTWCVDNDDSPVFSVHGLQDRADQSPISSLYLVGILSDFSCGLYYARNHCCPWFGNQGQLSDGFDSSDCDVDSKDEIGGLANKSIASPAWTVIADFRMTRMKLFSSWRRWRSSYEGLLMNWKQFSG